MINKYVTFIFSFFLMLPTLVNANAFDDSLFSNLDYGLYWAGADNQFEKAGADTADGSNYYDPSRPTIIYIHGWQPHTTKKKRRELFYSSESGRPDIDLANLWISKGYNIGVFYWNQFGDEFEVKNAEAKIWSVEGPKAMRWRDSNGDYHYGAVNQPVGELAYNSYTKAMSNYSGNDIRLVGHSLGTQVSMRLAGLLLNSAKAGLINENIVPNRVSLLDAFFSNGSKKFLDRNWIGEEVRDIADDLIKADVAIDSYRTSALTSTILAGDENKALHNKLAFAELSTKFFWSWQQTEKHVGAVWLYLWSIEHTPPVVENSTDLAISASASDELVKKWMKSNKHVKQVSGRYSKDPSDNIFVLTDRL